MRSFTEAKLFFVLLFSIIFILLSIFNVPSNRNILAKEATESEKEECKSESESNSGFCNIFGLKRAKLGKKSSPPDVFPTYNTIFSSNSSFLFFKFSSPFDKVDVLASHQYNIFSSTPRYIVFHALIFYEV